MAPIFYRIGNFVSYTIKASGRAHDVQWTSVMRRPKWNVDCALARRCRSRGTTFINLKQENYEVAKQLRNKNYRRIHMNQTVVKIENLVKRYKDVLALDHFNLEIEEGEVFGLLGPNGSGKTTTINCLLSLLTYDKGTIEVFGKPMRPDSYSLKRNIGVVMQNVAVFEELRLKRKMPISKRLWKRCLKKELMTSSISLIWTARMHGLRSLTVK